LFVLAYLQTIFCLIFYCYFAVRYYRF